jgi:hypothetical protein
MLRSAMDRWRVSESTAKRLIGRARESIEAAS